MADQQAQNLTLGFVGTDSLNKERFEALLDDLISLHRRTYKRTGVVTLLFSVEPTFSETMGQLADYAVKHDYKVGLVGHERYIRLVEEGGVDADEGWRVPLQPKDSVHTGMMRLLGLQNHANLILVGDPNDDDFVFEAFETADKSGIVTRSLLDDLGLVEMETPAPEEQPVAPADVFDDTDEFEDEFDDLEDSEESEEEADDEIEDEAEEEELEEEPDEEALAEIEAEADEIEEEPEIEVESAEEETVEDEFEEIEPSDEESEEEGQVEENVVATKRYTESQLSKLADNDWGAFTELAEELGVATGRGHKKSNIITGILDAQDGKAPAPKKRAPVRTKRAAKKVTTAKKTAPTKKVASKRIPSKAKAEGKRVSTRVSANGATPDLAAIEKVVREAAKAGVLDAFKVVARSS